MFLCPDVVQRAAVDGVVDCAQLEHVPPDPLDHVVQPLLRDGLVGERLGERLPEEVREPVTLRQIAAWHVNVQTSHDGRDSAASRKIPVGHHKPFKSPILPQSLVEKVIILASIIAIHSVVRAHNSSSISLHNTRPESREIHLLQSPLVDNSFHRLILRQRPETIRLLVISSEMLRTSQRTLTLNPLNTRNSKPSRQPGILGECFCSTAPERRS